MEQGAALTDRQDREPPSRRFQLVLSVSSRQRLERLQAELESSFGEVVRRALIEFEKPYAAAITVEPEDEPCHLRIQIVLPVRSIERLARLAAERGMSCSAMIRLALAKFEMIIQQGNEQLEKLRQEAAESGHTLRLVW